MKRSGMASIAQASARARAAAEQRARDHAAAEAEHEKQAGIGQQVGNWLTGAASTVGNWFVDNKSTIGTVLGAVGMVAGLLAFVPTPLSPLLAGISIGAGMASAAIDCSDGLDLSCGVSATGAVLGGAGFMAKGTRLIKPIDDALQLSDDSIRNADVVGTGLATLNGGTGLVGNVIDSRWDVRGW